MTEATPRSSAADSTTVGAVRDAEPTASAPRRRRLAEPPIPGVAADRLAAVHQALLSWYDRVGRDLPWRRTRDPYAILVSEIMLQQTQVDRVIPKLRQFLDAFPTVAALAAAPLGEVIRVWAGLGYNRRAVRLHAIARETVERLGGALPTTPEALQELEGLGTYTANAVACFSAEAQVAVVDTNVRRVLGRVFADEIGLEPPAGPQLQRFADAILPPTQAYPWNQALMDLGATICTSRSPRHELCPLALHCAGRALLTQAEPLKRSAESSAEYQIGLPEITPNASAAAPRAGRPRAASARTSQPFEQTTRYFRGRIVDACRALGPGETLGLDDLGRVLRSDYSPEHQAWVADLVEGLRSHGLVAVDDTSGEPRVSLP